MSEEITLVNTQKLRIYPNKSQKETIDFWFRRTNTLYNVCLEEKIYYYQATGKYLNLYVQKKELVGLKEFDPSWKDIPNKALSEMVFRLDRSYQAFFKGGGFPKFKDENKTLDFVKEDVRLKNGELYLPKIKTPVKFIEEFKGDWTSVKLTKEGNVYSVIFTYKNDKKINVSKNDDILGIDLGLKDLYTDSNGNSSGRLSVKLIKKYNKRIKELNQSLSKKKKGSIRFKKVKKNLGKAHKRLKETRNDYLNKKSISLLKCKGNIISVGNINVQSIIDRYKGVYSKKGMIKSFYANAVSEFKTMLVSKAFSVNKVVLLVSERDTTKTCSCCGNKKQIDLNERVYDCLKCKNSIGRDHNSAINMKSLGSSILSGCPDDFVLSFIQENNKKCP